MIKPILKSDQCRKSALKSKAKSTKAKAKEAKKKAGTRERAKCSPRLRAMVLERDGFKCCLCGATAATGAVLEVDHVVPIAQGGKSIEENLATLCQPCNAGKGAKTIEILKAIGHALK